MGDDQATDAPFDDFIAILRTNRRPLESRGWTPASIAALV